MREKRMEDAFSNAQVAAIFTAPVFGHAGENICIGSEMDKEKEDGEKLAQRKSCDPFLLFPFFFLFFTL